jgi:hypothetical protein
MVCLLYAAIVSNYNWQFTISGQMPFLVEIETALEIIRVIMYTNAQNNFQNHFLFFKACEDLCLITALYVDSCHLGCQMVCFQTKSPNLGKFWRVFQWKMLVYFMAIWSISMPFGLFHGHLVYLMAIWYIFPIW